MVAYYNEIDPKAAAWLRELIKRGLIASGEVDERDIRDVRPADLHGFAQCHFFAGIGVWSYALRRAGWPDDRPVWTGSCPCQPFSAAGKGGGFADERHLWPHFHHLIRECRPDVVFGEQVASKDGLAWFDLVQADLEGTGYAAGAVDLCAAGVGAPHIRQRLWWVGERLADAPEQGRLARGRLGGPGDGRGPARVEPRRLRDAGRLGDDDDEGLEGQRGGHSSASGWLAPSGPVAEAGQSGGLGDTRRERDEPRRRAGDVGRAAGSEQGQAQERERGRDAAGNPVADGTPGPTNGLWRDADWLFCRDGKWRPVEPGTFPLAHGAPARVGRLRGYGNAINAEAARVFIEAYLG